MYNLRELAQNFKTHGKCNVYTDELMSSRTSFKIGGKTELLVEPLDGDAFMYVLDEIRKNDVPLFVLGGGTNVVFSDGGFDGVVVSTAALKGIEVIHDDGTKVILRCLSGTLVNNVVRFCTENSFSGLEAFSGLPGTVGGAAFMNARCFDFEMSEAAVSACYVDYSSETGMPEIREISFSEGDWGYKHSPFTDKKAVILYVDIKVRRAAAEKEAIAEKCNSIMKQRLEKVHFKSPCAGSVFKNNHAFGAPVGKIVDELGLRSYRIGGAQIAPWHGNIIINADHATSHDVYELCAHIMEEVMKKKGFQLETEIIFAGNP